MKKILIFILCVFTFIYTHSQKNYSKDSVFDEKSAESKFHQSVGLGISNIEQKLLGPNTNLTSNGSVINLALNTNYKISEALILEGTLAALIGSSFNYYDYNNKLTNIYNTNSNFQRPINSSFTILSSSINFSLAVFKNKPSILFFIPNYIFAGPKYDALIGSRGDLKLNNYLGYQYGFKYKFGLKYLNIYPVLTISQSPNLYESGTPFVSNITNRYTTFSLYIESKAGIRKFKKYASPPKLKFFDIPLFKWRN